MPRDTPQPSARDAEWALMLAWVAGDEPDPLDDAANWPADGETAVTP